MSWITPTEVHYTNTSYPYSSAGSFMDFFEGFTYEHVNFIFADALHAQESMYPSMYMSLYKFGSSEPGSFSYYDHIHAHAVNDHPLGVDEYSRQLENSSIASDEQTAVVNTQLEGTSSTTAHANPVECPRSHHNARDHQVLWQDNIDPDNMTYEEFQVLDLLYDLSIAPSDTTAILNGEPAVDLLELGEAVGTQSRGLSQDLISLLPISKFKCGFFRKKSRSERCVVCQMEYKRGDRQITLPCKHVYHVDCGTRWLSINKACPICYSEVFGDGSKQ